MKNKSIESMEEAIDLIKKSNRIAIASHVNPDGDNLGSSIALTLALKKIKKNVTLLKSDIIPKDFEFLPGIDLIETKDDNLINTDLFIALDCGDPERLGDNKKIFEQTKKTINIDHHVSNTNFAHINVVDSTSAATGELIYNLIKQMNIEIDKDIATNLYTAISTDTGSFKYDSVSPDTHRIAADLLERGIDKNIINIKLYENMSFTRMKLFIKSLATLETFNDGKIAVVEVTQEMLKETEASLEDTEGIISFIRKIATVETACILKEIEKNNIKISMRTKEYMDASQICSNFEGGGHKRAAGCTINDSIENAKEIIVKSIQENMVL